MATSKCSWPSFTRTVGSHRTQRRPQHDIVWNFVSGHVVHLDLKSAGRSRHYDGLFRAGSQMQLNRVPGIPGGGLLDHGRDIQAVIAGKIHEIISDFGMIVRCGNCGPAAWRGRFDLASPRCEPRLDRGSAMQQADAKGQASATFPPPKLRSGCARIRILHSASSNSWSLEPARHSLQLGAAGTHQAIRRAHHPAHQLKHSDSEHEIH